jgi:hypothetical protein
MCGVGLGRVGLGKQLVNAVRETLRVRLAVGGGSRQQAANIVLQGIVLVLQVLLLLVRDTNFFLQDADQFLVAVRCVLPTRRFIRLPRSGAERKQPMRPCALKATLAFRAVRRRQPDRCTRDLLDVD